MHGDPQVTVVAPPGSGTINEGYRRYDRDGQKRYAHRLIMSRILGRPLHRAEVVHHIDGDKLNNVPSNLVVMTRSEHVKLHRSLLI